MGGESIGANSLGAIENPGSPSGRWEGFPVAGAFARRPTPQPRPWIHWRASAVRSGKAPQRAARQPSTPWDRGFRLSRQALSRQLAAMPCGRYLLRLIHSHPRRAFPGQRLWTAAQVSSEPMVRFVRARHRHGFAGYFPPYGWAQNAGSMLVDRDHAGPTVLDSMRRHGHEPCVVIQTSPGRLQCWIPVSAQPRPAAVAAACAGRLAPTDAVFPAVGVDAAGCVDAPADDPRRPGVTAAQAAVVYQTWWNRWRIPQRFPDPDWSIAELWIAKQRLWGGRLRRR